MKVHSGAIFATLAAALITALPVFSQIETGTIVGSVQDASGGAVPKAKVAIRSFATNLVVDTESNEAGRYQSPPLKPGAYNISVTSSGFKQSTSDVRVEVNERVAADFDAPGGRCHGARDGGSQRAAGGKRILHAGQYASRARCRRTALECPQFRDFDFPVPGTVPSFDRDSSGLSGTTRRGVTNASVNGVRPTNDWNSILIEGLDNTENHNAFGATVFPPIDAIQEFKVQTSGADAQFGHAAGGFTNVVLKSGGRDFHGALFEFLRNSEFDARNFFASPGSSTHFILNQFGATLGGPVTIPGLYNTSREKTFFFAALQFDRRRQAQAFISTIPTAAMRDGDFSGQPNRIYDPLTLSGNTRLPFANNVIPSNRFNSAGKGLLGLYPDPNRPGLTNNYASDSSRLYNSWQSDFKIDHYMTQSHSVTFRGSVGGTDIIEGLPFPLPAAASVGPSQFPVAAVLANRPPYALSQQAERVSLRL